MSIWKNWSAGKTEIVKSKIQVDNSFFNILELLYKIENICIISIPNRSYIYYRYDHICLFYLCILYIIYILFISILYLYQINDIHFCNFLINFLSLIYIVIFIIQIMLTF